MTNETNCRICEIIDFNPGIKADSRQPTADSRQPTADSRQPTAFIDMAALPTAGRDIRRIGQRDVASAGPKFRNGDTLLARITPCLENGKGAKVSGIPGNGVAQGSTEFIVMRAKDARDENFIYYLSRHPDFRSFAIKQMSGTSGRQRVAWQSLAEYIIPSLDIATRE